MVLGLAVETLGLTFRSGIVWVGSGIVWAEFDVLILSEFNVALCGIVLGLARLGL